jgi:hypothetical protein
MEPLIVIGLGLLMLWSFDRVGLALSNGIVVGLVRGFTAWVGGKFDAWPSGLQEEDRDQPWGSGRSAVRASSPPPPVVPLVRVRGVVRH